MVSQEGNTWSFNFFLGQQLIAFKKGHIYGLSKKGKENEWERGRERRGRGW